jgi:flagellar basal-body rod modification protein FlgD
MTSPISPLPGAPTPISQVTSPTGQSASAPKNSLDKDAFLKLLVAQLRYQDPSNPADATQFMAQTAQFTMVEKLADLADGQHELLSAQLRLGASNLVGRTVSYPAADGSTATGVVSSATFSGSSPTLRVGNMDVPLSSVTEVRTSAG